MKCAREVGRECVGATPRLTGNEVADGWNVPARGEDGDFAEGEYGVGETEIGRLGEGFGDAEGEARPKFEE